MREKYFQDKNGFSLWKKVVAGMSAGGEHRSVGEFFQSRPPSLEKICRKYTTSGFGQFMASPTDLIKTQIQMEGRRRLLGYEARVEGAADALRFFSV